MSVVFKEPFSFIDVLQDIYSVLPDMNVFPLTLDTAKYKWREAETPPGWNERTPMFWDRSWGCDYPLAPQAVTIKNVEYFRRHPDRIISEYKKFRDSGSTYGQWWLQKIDISGVVSAYASVNLPDNIFNGHDVLQAVAFEIGGEPCPYAGGTGDNRANMLDTLDIRDLANWWEDDPWGRKFNYEHRLWWWVPRFAAESMEGLNSQDAWHNMISTFGSPDRLFLIVWIMAFMHQHRCLRMLRLVFNIDKDRE